MKKQGPRTKVANLPASSSQEDCELTPAQLDRVAGGADGRITYYQNACWDDAVVLMPAPPEA